MKKAEYPQKTCREPLFSDSGLGYFCELQLAHLGPHASFSIPHTLDGRDRWEKSNPDLAEASESGDIIIP